MARLFINYRREDSGPYVDRLQDHLEQLFKEGEVFRDVYSITPGEDFKEALETGIETYDYVLVVIGPNWTSELKKRGARNATDYVRLEIETALRLDKKVIPVLVGGAQLPKEGELPNSLKTLLDKQTVELSNRHFKDDVTRLVDAMGGSWGSLKIFFFLPAAWQYATNQYYLLIELKGGERTLFWEVDKKGNVRMVQNPIFFEDWLKRQKPPPPVKDVISNRVNDRSFLDLKLKPGRYSLKVASKQRQLSFVKGATSAGEGKTMNFQVYSGDSLVYRATVTLDTDLFNQLVPKLEVETA